jgi:hypothetical protein
VATKDIILSYHIKLDKVLDQESAKIIRKWIWPYYCGGCGCMKSYW